MIKKRKPMFVSEEVHTVIGKLAREHGCTMGDVVDVKFNIRKPYGIEEAQKEPEPFRLEPELMVEITSEADPKARPAGFTPTDDSNIRYLSGD